jgi:drug/metabolite transporter (DMT)-like permease
MNNSAMNSTANSVSAPANNKISRLGNAVKNIGSTRETLDISWNTIGIITVLGLTYIVAASIGINTFSKCEKFKGKRLQENLNKILVATLGMAIAIPFTLSMTKMFSNEMPVFLLTYAIMGVVGSSIALNWTVNCDEAEKQSTTTIGVSLASFIAMLMFGVFLIVPKGKMGLE